MAPDFLALFLAIFLTVAPAAAQCYLPNGTDTNEAHGDDLYMSCGFKWPGAKHSMCCRLGDGGDTCLPNGLCSSDNIWRESCTDQTWKDPGCLQLYTEGVSDSGVDYSAQDITLRACDDGSYCTDSSNVTCCKYHDGFVLTNTTSQWSVVLPYNSTLSTSVSSQTPTPTASPSSTTTTATATPAPSSGISTGAVAGAVVGSVVVIALCLAVVVLLMRRNRRKRAREAVALLPYPGPDDKKGFMSSGSQEIDGQERLELDNTVLMHELPAIERTQELASHKSVHRAS